MGLYWYYRCMTKEPKKRRVGRPTIGDKAANKSLGSVRITHSELDEYTQAAELEGVKRTDWIRGELSKAARRVRKKHGVE